MEMFQIRCMLTASRTLNFTRAAAECNVSQPALTKAIKTLEAELGAPLFHRDGKRLRLSEFGQSVLPHLRQIMTEAEVTRTIALVNMPGRKFSPAAAAMMRAAQTFDWPG